MQGFVPVGHPDHHGPDAPHMLTTINNFLDFLEDNMEAGPSPPLAYLMQDSESHTLLFIVETCERSTASSGASRGLLNTALCTPLFPFQACSRRELSGSHIAMLQMSLIHALGVFSPIVDVLPSPAREPQRSGLLLFCQIDVLPQKHMPAPCGVEDL
jgi:hypothetical protein